MFRKIPFITLLIASTTFAHAETPEEMLQHINQARSSARQCGNQHYHSAPPLQLNPQLQAAAQKHADDMAHKNHFSHHSQNGQSPFDRIRAEGYRIRAAAENIAYGNDSIQDATASWLKSSGHCRNIMSPIYRETGIAQSGQYWVQVFATAP